ncbi:MAG: flagellar hook-length control protein FliK, partial [Pseudomonas sp.]
MTGDMNIPPLPQVTATTRMPAVTGELLKLLAPAEGLIGPGQTAQAEVLSLKQADQ